MSAENTASQAVETVLTSDKIAAAVSGGAVTAGIGSWLLQWQPHFAIVSTICGSVLAIVLIVKHVLDTYWKYKTYKKGDYDVNS